MSEFKPGDKVWVRGEVLEVFSSEQALVEFFSKTDQWKGWVRSDLISSGVVLDLDAVGSHLHPNEQARGGVVTMLRDTSSKVAAKVADQIEAQTRPAIEEPTGLGAVVEDDRGFRWVRYRTNAVPWKVDDDSMFDREWSQITAVRVLSEGAER